MTNLKKRHKGYSGTWVSHYAKCDDWEGYFYQTSNGKMFTDSKLDGSRWEDGYLFHLRDYPDSIELTELKE